MCALSEGMGINKSPPTRNAGKHGERKNILCRRIGWMTTLTTQLGAVMSKKWIAAGGGCCGARFLSLTMIIVFVFDRWIDRLRKLDIKTKLKPET